MPVYCGVQQKSQQDMVNEIRKLASFFWSVLGRHLHEGN